MLDVPLSVLELAPITDQGASAGLADVTEVAKAVERLGYSRLWVAEHHNMEGIGSSSPAVLLAHLAAHTSKLVLGSGGVMLPNHSPLVIAEQFGMLQALHPGRIELGIGRAPGTDQVTAALLRRGSASRGEEDFPLQFDQMRAFFRNDEDSSAQRHGIFASPTVRHEPPIWLLGSSTFGAQMAGHLGLPFAFAYHFAPEFLEAALEAYRSSFQPSESLSAPKAMVAVSVLAAESDDEAQRLALPGALQFARFRLGRPELMRSTEEVAAIKLSQQEETLVQKRSRHTVVGSPQTVLDGLQRLLAVSGANELMITTSAYELSDRVRSFELVAELAKNGVSQVAL